MNKDEQTTGSDFGSLLKKFFTKLPKPGELVTGRVISVSNGEVRLDIDGMTTGVVRGPELFSESAEYANIKIGEDAEATVLEPENENGEMELSFKSAGRERVWERMRKHMEDGIVMTGKITHANKGGLIVQVDAISAFMPVSQLTPEKYPRVPGGDKHRILDHLKTLIGQDVQVKVIDVNQKDEKLIVSEKEVWEDEQKAVLEQYKIGDVIEGEVSAITSFGAFIKFGEGLEGLVHISEIAWQRIDHPKDVLKLGDRVKAQIIDLNKSKIYLSMKRLMDDPWKRVKDNYTVGQEIEGEVHKVEPFGLMVKLDDEIHGLAHISEVSDAPVRDEKELAEKFPVGSMQVFEIINIEPAEHRLGLKVKGVKGKRARKEEAGSKEPAAGRPETSGIEEQKPAAANGATAPDAVQEEEKAV